MKKILLILMLLLSGCTNNIMARKYGGHETINLPVDSKLVTVTWHNEDLWILTRPMRQDDKAENYELTEKSSYGVLSGSVSIVENKTK